MNLRLRKSGSKCAVKVFFSKLKMTPYGESENGKYEADVRLFALTIRLDVNGLKKWFFQP